MFKRRSLIEKWVRGMGQLKVDLLFTVWDLELTAVLPALDAF